MSGLARYRRFYSEEIRAVAGLRSEALVQALATVPREAFLGPGPWQILSLNQALGEATYRPTPDDNPEHVYHNVAVAIDASRQLNNGQPSALAPAMDALNLRRGERAVHIGAGTGYYSAVLAEMVGPDGHLVAIEVDPALAERARANLASRPWVRVVHGNASELDGSFAGILVNAGATHPRSQWLDALAPDGRLVLPLTATLPGMPFPSGFFVNIRRGPNAYSVELISPISIFNCEGARDETVNAKLVQLLRQGGWKRIRSLRRDSHPEGDSCLVHTAQFCLSGVPSP